MIPFFAIAGLLVVATAALLLPPLWRGRRPQREAGDRKAANLAIFRDQLAELEREQAEGTLAAADFEQARQELRRRLLEEVEGEAEAGADAKLGPTRKTAVALVIALPLLALAGYGILGNPQALDPARRVAQPEMTPEQINAMVERLAEKMKANPDDEQGWLMLGRSYKMLGRYDEAVAAYARAEKTIERDPELLAGYAETIAMASGRGLAGKPAALIEKALKLDPEHGHSLFLAGAAAIESGDKAKAIAYWERLLPQVEPGSELDRMLREGIDKLKQGGK